MLMLMLRQFLFALRCYTYPARALETIVMFYLLIEAQLHCIIQLPTSSPRTLNSPQTFPEASWLARASFPHTRLVSGLGSFNDNDNLLQEALPAHCKFLLL